MLLNKITYRFNNIKRFDIVVINAERFASEDAHWVKRVIALPGETIAYELDELLKYLALNKGIVLTRDKIMESVWGFDFQGESRTVDMHIKTLRQKLGQCGNIIQTVRNVGYKML